MSWLEENIKEELMEVAECTKIVLDRLQQFETENVNKIFGYLLLRRSHEEIIQYAHGPDNQILSLIDEAKSFIARSSKLNNSRPASIHPLQCMPSPGPFSSPSRFREPGHQMGINNFDHPSPFYTDLIGGRHNGEEFVNLEDQLQPDFSNHYYYPEGMMGGSLVVPRNGIQSPNGGIEIPQRACPYFYKGMCKHGINCRNLHGRTSPDTFYIPNMNELANDDHTFVAGSLEKLELEITELLRSRRGIPVSIASLPMIYQEMYGKTLQAEGYLTESQRHGKAGFNLTKLLARLKNSIQLIDRPHGQHSVVLAEDAAKYMDHRNERCDSGVILGSSHQIYLTFPAESSFSEDDVYKYFRLFGPVHDVRIPRQEKRMFGFVSFWYPETVKLILEKGHPHYICGARVLVKPYKEKSRIADKKYTEKIEIPMCYSPQYYELDQDPNSFPRLCGNSRILEKQLQEYQHFLELERRRLFRLRLTPEPPPPQSYFGYGLDELKHPQADRSAPSPAWNNCSTNDEKTTPTSDIHVDQDSGHIELPDSPFASPRVESNVSTTL